MSIKANISKVNADISFSISISTKDLQLLKSYNPTLIYNHFCGRLPPAFYCKRTGANNGKE